MFFQEPLIDLHLFVPPSVPAGGAQPPPRHVHRAPQADPPQGEQRCQARAGERHGAQPQAGGREEAEECSLKVQVKRNIELMKTQSKLKVVVRQSHVYDISEPDAPISSASE